MNSLKKFTKQWKKVLKFILPKIIQNPKAHAKWLNTLSYLENCGAKLIARSEHPTMVTQEVLKHAAEEFRHAYYLKTLIPKIYPPGIPNYRLHHLIGGINAYHYLPKLNISISRWLKYHLSLKGPELKEIAYPLVTYAIEMRAIHLYKTYENCLNEQPISIKSIIREEKHHLAEIEAIMQNLAISEEVKEAICLLEAPFFQKWHLEIRKLSK